jgi:hypothetical protein
MSLLESLTQLLKDNVWASLLASGFIGFLIVEVYRLTLQQHVDKYFEDRRKKINDRQIAQRRKEFFENFAIVHTYKTGKRSESLDNARLLTNVAILTTTMASMLVIALLVVALYPAPFRQFYFLLFVSFALYSVFETRSTKNTIDLRRLIYFQYEFHKKSLERDGYRINEDGSVERISDDRKNHS